MQGELVLTFLLQSADLPRSVFGCLVLAESLLAELGPQDATSLRRKAGRLRSSVEFVEAGVLGPGLGAFLENLEAGIVDLAGEVERTYFRPATANAMHSSEAF